MKKSKFNSIKIKEIKEMNERIAILDKAMKDIEDKHGDTFTYGILSIQRNSLLTYVDSLNILSSLLRD